MSLTIIVRVIVGPPLRGGCVCGVRLEIYAAKGQINIHETLSDLLVSRAGQRSMQRQTVGRLGNVGFVHTIRHKSRGVAVGSRLEQLPGGAVLNDTARISAFPNQMFWSLPFASTSVVTYWSLPSHPVDFYWLPTYCVYFSSQSVFFKLFA